MTGETQCYWFLIVMVSFQLALIMRFYGVEVVISSEKHMGCEQKVALLCWTVALGAIQTQNSLWRRGKHVINCCYVQKGLGINGSFVSVLSVC